MLTMTLDLATNTGFAIGPAGQIPRSGTVRLKKREDEQSRAARNLGCFLRDTFALERPDILVYEAALPAAAMLGMGNASETADMAWQLVGVVEAICGCYGVRTIAANVQTVRKHFTGRARWGDRSSAKHAVIDRCHLLGYFPRNCRDDNRADACALFDWAAATYAPKSARPFALFGQPAEVA